MKRGKLSPQIEHNFCIRVYVSTFQDIMTSKSLSPSLKQIIRIWSLKSLLLSN